MKNDEEDVEVNYITEKDIIMYILLGALINRTKKDSVSRVFLVFFREMFYSFEFFWSSKS